MSDDLYQFCENSADIKRSDFANNESGAEQYTEAVQSYFTSLLSNSKYDYLVEQLIEAHENKPPNTSPSGSTLVAAPINWITNILADFSLNQSRINQKAICKIEIPEPANVVSIVASDKVLGKHQGKTLVLHLVTFENYPKRGQNSTYWQHQIPEARNSYDWKIDGVKLLII